MIPPDTPIGTEVWSYSWGNAWHGQVKAITKQKACVSDELHVKPLDQWFPTEAAALSAMIKEANEAAQKAMAASIEHSKRLAEIHQGEPVPA